MRPPAQHEGLGDLTGGDEAAELSLSDIEEVAARLQLHGALRPRLLLTHAAAAGLRKIGDAADDCVDYFFYALTL